MALPKQSKQLKLQGVVERLWDVDFRTCKCLGRSGTIDLFMSIDCSLLANWTPEGWCELMLLAWGFWSAQYNSRPLIRLSSFVTESPPPPQYHSNIFQDISTVQGLHGEAWRGSLKVSSKSPWLGWTRSRDVKDRAGCSSQFVHLVIRLRNIETHWHQWYIMIYIYIPQSKRIQQHPITSNYQLKQCGNVETVETKAHEKGHLLPLVRSSTPWHGWLPISVWQQDVPPHLQVVGWWPSTDPKVATCRCGPASCSCPEWECWLFWNDGRCYGRVSFWSFWLGIFTR